MVFIFLFCFFLSPHLFADDSKSPLDFFKDREIDIIPVPVFETRPDEGQSYGLMPIMLMSDHDKQIKTILGIIAQYNTHTKFGVSGLAYFYPHPDQEIEFFTGWAQQYYRELSLRFFDPTFFDNFYLDSSVTYLKTPFGRFFGFGPDTPESAQSNFVSSNIKYDITFGYSFAKYLRANFKTALLKTDLSGRAITDIADTLTTYGALPNVVDAMNFVHGASFVYDTRPEKEYSRKGTYLEATFGFSSESLGSDQDYQKVKFEAMQLVQQNERFMTAFRFNFEEYFGSNIPFYQMSSLGGENEMRAFTPLRFVDKGKMLFQIEERISLIKWKLFGIPFEIHTDPFVEIGRVFSSLDKIGWQDWKPVGGVGFRLFVPPNIVGRLDVAAGQDGIEIYTELGYPF